MNHCRHCDAPLSLKLIDLGTAPPSNAYVSAEQLATPELWYPLRVLVCERCWLVQTEDYAARETLFSADYAYFSSTSASWLAHAKAYVGSMTERFGLSGSDFAVEVAANDGYLLQYYRERGIPCLGVEPTAATANAARAKGLDIAEMFFGNETAQQLLGRYRAASIVAANNVLAHVPDINDFVTGFATILKPEGVATFEFPHLSELMRGVQFDTIYHEHYSYLSLTTVVRIFEHNGLSVFDVERLPTHGGSLRVFAQRRADGKRRVEATVDAILRQEQAEGVTSRAYYETLQPAAERVKDGLLAWLIEAKRAGLKVAAYGAAAKGNTLLNFAGVRADLVRYVVDRSPGKQGRFLPGSRIPIVSEDHLRADRPDRVLILPWNLRAELEAQLAYVREWGGQLVAAVPELTVWGEGGLACAPS
ncbi:MAG: methyltransferase domain-containing protein [Alphaproteobacteria bacterium]|nr:methyltransferase domain-containing protein [Alphaproteobacteria bacterium]